MNSMALASMTPKFCMYEHFDLIINPFKYKCEIYQVFICPFLKIVMINHY
jgi:hypothetical protein